MNNMTIDEISDILYKKYEEDIGYKPYCEKRFFHSRSPMLIKHFSEQPYKNFLIAGIAKENPPHIPYLMSLGFIKNEEIIEVSKTTPEIFYDIPYECYNNDYPKLFDEISENKNVKIALLPDKIRNMNRFSAKYKEQILSGSYISIEDFDKLPNTLKNDEDIKNKFICDLTKIADKSKLPSYDFLPTQISQNETVKKMYDRTKKIYNSESKDHNGYDTDWLDSNGNIIPFFSLKYDFPIKTKDDYLKIVEIYTKSSLSVPHFCSIYGISSPDGFNRLLKRVGYESYDAQKNIDKIKEDAQKRFLILHKEIAQKIDKGEMTFEDYMKKSTSLSNKFKWIYEYTALSTTEKKAILDSKSKEEAEAEIKEISHEKRSKLMNQVIDYIKNNKYELDVKKLYRLFIEEKDEEIEISKLFKTINGYLYDAGIGNQNNFEALKILDKYKGRYNKVINEDNVVSKINCIDGKEYIVTSDMENKAISYLENHKIYICGFTVARIAGQIAKGELKYSEPSKLENYQVLKSELSQAKSIDDYMNIMENNFERDISDKGFEDELPDVLSEDYFANDNDLDNSKKLVLNIKNK
jgi:hypothetical protein